MGIKISWSNTSISFWWTFELKFYERRIKINPHLELGAHARQYSPKYLNTNVKNLKYGADSVTTQAKAKVLVDRLYE